MHRRREISFSKRVFFRNFFLFPPASRYSSFVASFILFVCIFTRGLSARVLGAYSRWRSLYSLPLQDFFFLIFGYSFFVFFLLKVRGGRRGHRAHPHNSVCCCRAPHLVIFSARRELFFRDAFYIFARFSFLALAVFACPKPLETR